jgi:hypothetical protein
MYMCCNVQVLRLRNSDQEEVDDDLFSLACGPDFRIKKILIMHCEWCSV